MFLPVRHHSPACARMVRDAIRRLSPKCILIEGPSDYNDRIEELFLDHQPPIAIYSYVAWEDGVRQGAYYPMCVYSPEWQALQEGRKTGAEIRFIDLPYAVLAREDKRVHRYSDGKLGSSDYIKYLCQSLEVDSFDDAWDLIAEQDDSLSGKEIHERLTTYCRNLRGMDEEVPGYDIAREKFMASHIRAAETEFGKDQILVVTGGYHTSGLEEILENKKLAKPGFDWPEGIEERGIALTPYSYERLDSLVGYEAGMPSPGFYHRSWEHVGDEPLHIELLKKIAAELRRLKQTVSTADLIAVESCATSLASLRGHARVWRRDLRDAVQAALVKDDLYETHPFVLVLEEILRGGERGRLSDAAPLPPLVKDIQHQLKEADLTPEKRGNHASLVLTDPADLEKSYLLHQVKLLDIPGFERTRGADFKHRENLTSLTEEWRIRWAPEMESAMIEASRYGSALREAVSARLFESLEKIERESAAAAVLLLDAVLANVLNLAEPLREKYSQVVDHDGDLGSVSTALNHLLYLYSWDDTFGHRDSDETGELLERTWDRALWLLESGGPAPDPQTEVDSVRLIRDSLERAGSERNLDRDVFSEVLARVQSDSARPPAQRGACAGALWSMQCTTHDEIQKDLMLFTDPEKLGDFLTGLFGLAREEAQRDEPLLKAINEVIMEWNEDGFLTALPSLRLAFTYFTPREKNYMAATLFAMPAGETADLLNEPEPLAVSSSEAAAAMEFEARIRRLAETYGVNLTMDTK